MFTHRVTRKALGEVLGITGPNMGKKLRGEVSWSLADLYGVADYFSIPVEELLPKRVQSPMSENADTPSQLRGGSGNVVAGAGFEPTTSGL
ncbi:helix-turn-helix domain-containing protein [Corynebacterium sp. 13CS0277]|uniref:helix-turn-helix domain-containing protein n=1 Tax=Corynebacterium sp. 13CS0277 TaxID=2071994 RepID=UPI0027120317|nr:helix-turn-helix domain-containing protein [Corynebacterium sp. 13CS0277]